MSKLGYFTLPISAELGEHSVVTVLSELPALDPGRALYQCIYEPTESGEVTVSSLESVFKISSNKVLSNAESDLPILESTVSLDNIEWELFNKNERIASFTLGQVVQSGFEDLSSGMYKPANLRVHHQSLYSRIVGAQSLEGFLASRKAPKQRAHIQALFGYLNLDDLRNFLNISYGLSMIDTIWVRPVGLLATWEDVNLFDNNFSDVVAHYAFTGSGFQGLQLAGTSPEYGTDGALPKCWIRDTNGEVKLLKGSTAQLGFRNSGFEPHAEYYASQIAKRMSYYPYVEYDVVNMKGGISSLCPLFTSKELAYISMAKELATRGRPWTEYLSVLADNSLGESYRDLLFFDCVICNTDRHLGNFGLVTDTTSYGTVSLSPIFDNGESLGHLWMPDNADSILEYASHLGPKLMSESFVTVGRQLLNERRRAALERLKGWTVPKHTRYNWPELKYEAMNDLVQHQIKQILGS